MEQAKDYSLLRPFDLEAAKNGALLTGGAWTAHLFDGTAAWKYIAGPDVEGNVLVEIICSGRFSLFPAECFCMAPLCWVEGRPVYPGDNLYWKNGCGVFTAGGRMVGVELNSLTWSKPKRTVKKAGWINIYPLVGKCGQAGQIYPTKTAADNSASSARIACIRVEWEETTQ